MKRVVGLLVLFLALALFSQDVLAVKPGVEFRPETPDVISKDASFLIIVDPKTYERPMRITWSVYDTGSEGIGSFPIINGKGVCYFSSDDENATCGPSPFTEAGPTELYVYVITPDDVENQTVAMNISNIEIPMGGVYRKGNTVYMYFYVEQYDSFTYKIYHDDFTFFANGVPEYQGSHARYAANKTLNPGVYYFAFYAEKDGVYGTNLARIDIPSGDYLTLKTSEESYWKGENALITGTTNSGEVSGTVYFPNGTRAMNFDITLAADNFSREFRIPLSWPEGKYNVTTSRPLVKSVTFSAADLIEITPKSVREKIDKSDDFEKSITLKNLGTGETNLSLVVTGDIGESDVTLGSGSLEGGASTTLSISVSNVQVNLAGRIRVSADPELELDIPVRIYVEEPVDECPECPAGGVSSLEITPKVWSQNCIKDETITQTLVLRNRGDSTVSQFTYDVDDVYSDNSLSDLKSTGDLDLSLSGVSVGAGETGSAEISITPYNTGSYKGIVTVTSSGGDAYMFVSLECFEDMGSEISLLIDELDNLGLNPDSDVYSDIHYLLGNAQDAYDVGNYPELKSNLDKARAKIVTVQDLGGAVPGGMDLTIPIIIIVIVIVVAGLVYYFKFRRKGGGEFESAEEEFEDEF